jgi:hypothetical protein
MIDRLTTSTEHQELKESFIESPPGPGHARLQRLQNVHLAGGHTQEADTIIYGGAFQGCSHKQHIGSQIGIHAHQIPPGKQGHLCMEACSHVGSP